MKIVVIGGSGLIGKKLIAILSNLGHEAISASPSSGVNTLTGEGLPEVLKGANVVVDVSNSPSFEDAAVLEFFETSNRNLLAAEIAAGVGHHVALSVVGADRLPDSGYMRAKLAQEALIRASKVPYTIVRATQFHEFMGGIAASCDDGVSVRVPTAPMQPIGSDDVARFLADYVVGPAQNGIREIAGPESKSISEFVQQYLSANSDTRTVVADPNGRYFGTALDSRGLTAGEDARLSQTTFEEWLGRVPSQAK